MGSTRIQLELGRALRENDHLTTTADRIAAATLSFANDFLPIRERRSSPDADVPVVNVGVYVDDSAGRSVNQLLSVLSRFESVSVTRLLADDIREGKHRDFDLVIQPGGSGGGQGRKLGEDGRKAIREYVKDGGGFVGICAGAYLASAHYSWSLDILDAKVLDTKHWNRGTGTVEISLTDEGQKFLGTREKTLSIYYGQGPLLAPAERPDIADYELLASFETEIARNGAPSGVMKGTTAIARGNYGAGRVVCFSPHPEMTDGLEKLLLDAINHVKRGRAVSSAR